MKKSVVLVFAAVVVLVVCLTGCQPETSATPTADIRQANETKMRLAEADRQVGMPDITRFTERKLAKDILELRDKEIATWTYIVNLNGDLIFLGTSIGYGLPYSVQFTNPVKLIDAERALNTTLWEDSGRVQTVPQADPNGLFMPDGLSATWIMLKGPDGKVHPTYVEPEILVSPFPLHKKGERIVRAGGHPGV